MRSSSRVFPLLGPKASGGPLPPGSPPLPSRAGPAGSQPGLPPCTSLLALGLRGTHPSFRKRRGKEAKAEIKCQGGEGEGCVRKGRPAGAAARTPGPRGQAERPRASEVRPLSSLRTLLLANWTQPLAGPSRDPSPVPCPPSSSSSHDPRPFPPAAPRCPPALGRSLPNLSGRRAEETAKRRLRLHSSVSGEEVKKKKKKHTDTHTFALKLWDKLTAKLGSCSLISAGISLTLHVCRDRRWYLVLMPLPCRRRTLYDKILSNIRETIRVSKFNAKPFSRNPAPFFL